VTAFVERPLGFSVPESTEQEREGVGGDIAEGGLLWVRYARLDGVVVQVDSPRTPVTRSSKLWVASTRWPGLDVLASENGRSLVRVDTGDSLQPVTITIISTDN